MTQTIHIVNALKRALKAHGISYAEVARRLGLSESSVKRLFSTRAFSLQRLEAVCDMAGLDLLELAQLADAEKLRVPSLTERQEREIVGNPELLLVAVCALNRWSFERILEQYKFTRNRLTAFLARLQHMGLIEVLSGNRIRPLVTRNFGWLPGGPIHRFFVDRLQGEFLAGGFSPHRDVHKVSWGMVSAESASVLKAKINELTDTFDHLTQSDEVRADAAASGTCLLVALRAWEPSHFQNMRRTA